MRFGSEAYAVQQQNNLGATYDRNTSGEESKFSGINKKEAADKHDYRQTVKLVRPQIMQLIEDEIMASHDLPFEDYLQKQNSLEISLKTAQVE